MVREDELLPELFWAADEASMQGQHKTVRLLRQQLVMLTLASIFSSFDARLFGIDWPSWLAAVMFASAALATFLLNRGNPQAIWYEGRAVAESLKTLVWKYAIRADPFTPPGGEKNPEALYRLQLADVLHTFRNSAALPLPVHADITPAMRRLRDSPLRVRHDVYLRERVRVQHDWYTAKEAACETRGRRFGRVATLLPVCGIAAPVIQMGGWFPVNTLSFIAAIAASVSAWAQLRQYRPLAAAYRVAADELELIRVHLAALDLTAPDAEETWSHLTRDAEDAVSREHTTWQARRELRV
jgi:hypothetical protein